MVQLFFDQLKELLSGDYKDLRVHWNAKSDIPNIVSTVGKLYNHTEV